MPSAPQPSSRGLGSCGAPRTVGAPSTPAARGTHHRPGVRTRADVRARGGPGPWSRAHLGRRLIALFGCWLLHTFLPRVRKAAGVSTKLHFHDLRRTGNTLVSLAGPARGS